MEREEGERDDREDDARGAPSVHHAAIVRLARSRL
jgi:hypothetical protein